MRNIHMLNIVNSKKNFNVEKQHIFSIFEKLIF